METYKLGDQFRAAFQRELVYFGGRRVFLGAAGLRGGRHVEEGAGMEEFSR